MKKVIPVKHYFLKDINPVVRFMILSDTIIIGSAGLLGPIFALFIEDFIIGGNEAVAGIAAGVFLFSRSLLQIPIARMIDRIYGEKDDFWFMFIFSILIGTSSSSVFNHKHPNATFYRSIPTWFIERTHLPCLHGNLYKTYR